MDEDYPTLQTVCDRGTLTCNDTDDKVKQACESLSVGHIKNTATFWQRVRCLSTKAAAPEAAYEAKFALPNHYLMQPLNG